MIVLAVPQATAIGNVGVSKLLQVPPDVIVSNTRSRGILLP